MKLKLNILLAIFSVLLLSACVSLITPKVQPNLVQFKSGGYSLDKTHARLLFKIRHLGLSTYVGRFNDFDASLQFDPSDMSSAKLTDVIDMGSVDINDAGLEKDLIGRSWFRVSEFPQASFESTRVTTISDSEFEFTGNSESVQVYF